MGYVEVNLKIPEIIAFDEDMLMLVIKNSEYTRVPIQLGTLHINRAPDIVNKKRNIMIMQWRQGKIALLLTGKTA